jgi:glyoxylase-like metal-dependent hydrolase (beta-lactamase superfamily II)
MLVGVFALCAVLLASLLLLRRQTYSVFTERVTDGVYLFTATGLNALAVVADDGVVLVDTMQNGWWGPALESALRQVTDKPITTIINTNSHPSHSGNNFRFAGDGVVVVAQEQTAARLGARENFKGANARYLPQTTFRDRLTLMRGTERIELYYFGASNTDGDAWVVFPSRRLVHIGDVVKKNEVMEIEENAGGSGLYYAQTMARGIAAIKDVDFVVTGHARGGVATFRWGEMAGYHDSACALIEKVGKAMASAGSADAVVSLVQADPTLSRYDQVDVESAVRTIHTELTAAGQNRGALPQYVTCQ